MRTTVDLDADILVVVKHMAKERQQSLGRVLSTLVRQSLQPQQQVKARSGSIPVLPRKPDARPVTSQIVKELMDLEN
jgi:hypothetical protein